METNPISDKLPLMGRLEYAELLESIRAHGLRDPITLDGQGAILDGRNRWRACTEAGVPVKFERFKGGNPWLFVWDRNATRRHLAQGKKAALFLAFRKGSAAWEAEREKQREAANAKRSQAAGKRPRDAQGRLTSAGQSVARTGRKHPAGNKSRKAAAGRAHVSAGTMQKAEMVEQGAPDLYEQVCTGPLTLDKAVRILMAPRDRSRPAGASGSAGAGPVAGTR